MKRIDVIKKLIHRRTSPEKTGAEVFCPINIALCKYWGKRNPELNLPANSSFSITLPEYGTKTFIAPDRENRIFLNGKPLDAGDIFSARLFAYLQDFKEAGVIPENIYFRIQTKNNIPTAAGLASSASGFAALISALNLLFAWDLPLKELSILARLGSGSACRSLFPGFSEWKKGKREDGMDSYAVPFKEKWQELRLGILSVSGEKKAISSRDAMLRTARESVFYSSWLEKAEKDVTDIKKAILNRDFEEFGRIAEANCLAMHATMMTCSPAIIYWQPETVKILHKIRQLREEGLEIYYTMDAGPNVKIIFPGKDQEVVRELFPGIRIASPFAD